MTTSFTEKFKVVDASIRAESNEHKNLSVLMHVLPLVGFPVLGPLIVWLVKKDSSPYLDAQGRELLNAELSWFLIILACGVLSFCLIGIPLLFVVGLGSFVCRILAIIKAAEGTLYRFPFIYRFL